MCARLAMIVCAATTASWAFAQNHDYRYPHDFKDRDSAKIYLIEDSRGSDITITADGVVVWKGVVAKADEHPNIHVAGIPAQQQEKCKIRITGGPYTATRDVE